MKSPAFYIVFSDISEPKLIVPLSKCYPRKSTSLVAEFAALQNASLKVHKLRYDIINGIFSLLCKYELALPLPRILAKRNRR